MFVLDRETEKLLLSLIERERRYQVVAAWQRAIRVARAKTKWSIGRITAAFLRRHPGIGQTTLYRWERTLRSRGYGALGDGRRARL